MGFGATVFAFPVLTAVWMCGCNSESAYNIPADSAKDAAAIGAGAPTRNFAAGRTKTTKPPGGAPKESSNLRPSG
jgi:hypothetical protein